jgi:outer membrane lipoprotein-sorting protein
MGPRRAVACLALLVPLGIAIFGATLSQGNGGPAGTPAAPVRGNDDIFLKQVRSAILASQPFRVDFVQQVFIDGTLELQESGVIVFAHREQVKWEYTHPESKIFILQKDRYRFYDRENNQLLAGRVGTSGEQLIWELLLAEQPGGTVRWDAATRTVFLSVPGQEGPQQLHILVGADFLPQRVEQTAENGVTTVYRFRNYRRRIALAAGEFDLDLPADVDIVEEPLP